MIPVLFHVGPLPVYAYGFLVALGVLASALLMRRHGVRMGLKPGEVLDLVLYFTLASFAGARVFYVVQHWDYYAHRPMEIFAIWEGGVVFYGGALGALIFLGFYAARKKWSYFQMTDFLAPYVFLTHGFGRVGCFLNGCCYGKESHLPWAVQYPFLPYPVHPVQIYSAAFNVAACALLLWMDSKKRFHGETTVAYVLIYGSGRFLLEFLRGDHAPFLWQWTLPQTLSVVFVCVAALSYAVYFRRQVNAQNRDSN